MTDQHWQWSEQERLLLRWVYGMITLVLVVVGVFRWLDDPDTGAAQAIVIWILALIFMTRWFILRPRGYYRRPSGP